MNITSQMKALEKNPKTDALKIYTSTLYILTLAFICSTQFSQLSYVTDKDYFLEIDKERWKVLSLVEK